MEQWKKYLTESQDFKDSDYTDPLVASDLAYRIARKIAHEAGDTWSWVEEDLSQDGNDLKYVMEIGIQPGDKEDESETLASLIDPDPFKYFKENYAALEEIYIDRKEAASRIGKEDEWVRNFKETLEQLAEWIKGL